VIVTDDRPFIAARIERPLDVLAVAIEEG